MIEKMGFPVGPVVDNLRASAEAGSIPGSGRSSGGSNGNPFQHSCLENPWSEAPGGLQLMGSQRIWRAWVAEHKSTTDNVSAICLRLVTLGGGVSDGWECRLHS